MSKRVAKQKVPGQPKTYPMPPRQHPLSQVYDRKYTGYGDKVSVAYGVWHPKEMVSRFQETVLGRDIALDIFNFLQSSQLYKQFGADPILKEHSKVFAHFLAGEKEISQFGELIHLLDAQLTKIKQNIDSENECYNSLRGHFVLLEDFLEDKIAKRKIEAFTGKLTLEQQKKVTLYTQLNDALVHLTVLAKRQSVALDESLAGNQPEDFKLSGVEKFTEGLTAQLMNLTQPGNHNVEISTLYSQINKFLNFLRADVAKIIEPCGELVKLHEHFQAINSLLKFLNISALNVISKGAAAIKQDYLTAYGKRHSSEQTQKATLGLDEKISPSSPGNIFSTCQNWFRTVYSTCADYIDLYPKLSLAVDDEAVVDLQAGGLKGENVNLLSMKERVDSALLFQAQTKEIKTGAVKEKAIWLRPEVTVTERDILSGVFSQEKDLKPFDDCQTAQEKYAYIKKLYTYLSEKCVAIKTHINDRKQRFYAGLASKSDAFMVAVPSNPKSWVIFGRAFNFFSPHQYSRELVGRVDEKERSSILPQILNFSDRYFQLVYMVHYLQFQIGKSDLNGTSDEVIAKALDKFSGDLNVFLESIAKVEKAALELDRALGVLAGKYSSIKDPSLSNLRSNLTLFLKWVAQYDKEFETSCNHPTAGGPMGVFKNEASLKERYGKLYQVFNYFRLPARRHQDHTTQPSEQTAALPEPKSDFGPQSIASLQLRIGESRSLGVVLPIQQPEGELENSQPVSEEASNELALDVALPVQQLEVKPENSQPVIEEVSLPQRESLSPADDEQESGVAGIVEPKSEFRNKSYYGIFRPLDGQPEKTQILAEVGKSVKAFHKAAEGIDSDDEDNAEGADDSFPSFGS